MHAYLHCLSHSPLVGYVDPAQAVLDEVNGVIASARARIAAFEPELVVLFAPDHYNGFFYDVMPPFCLGVGATAIGDFGSAAGELPVPTDLAEACAHAGNEKRYRSRRVLQHAGRSWLRAAAGVFARRPG
ncbi:2,3-dihydroxyphenylpropionate/2, 3-dihydroxicinnamic acid 1,2- dioxygenase [Escherichia coli]|uniref:2,3-dihydroxyphenylpropionate/2, 3-dihydroxicinnamic acid 1,2- dioxygenase n=1 Tax=Escherichia coli TaxID=562 RepID=A0A2X1KEK8_ECOLX|nr:2,3-dihydroxyphenylpropionate/2, 3-dihydroxicinnamic acid 1,2- dioxygenase [Escherichia coli]